jgi:GT2 family glycosyltransferase
MTTTPRISVVVATRERAALLARLVRALEAQRGLDCFEVLIVDDASEDGTWEELGRLAASARCSLRPLRLGRHLGPAGARNAGWRAAGSSLVAFTDDDCVPQPDWLRSILKGLTDADIVQGATLPHPQQYGNRGPFCRTMEVTGETWSYPTCNIGYRRSLLERLNGFDATFRHPAGEDVDLAWRARDVGARIAFLPQAQVFHDVRPSSFVVHLRDTVRWEGMALAVQRNPRLRAVLHWHWFWKPSHPLVLLALAGLILASVPRHGVAGRSVAMAAVTPYLVYRVAVQPLRGSRRQQLTCIPLAFVADLTEVAVLLVASVRYRTLLL